jgi:phosphoribosyl-AMP cyclohydrolase / phosphoribosyl-ATP pyrophosphohydrolase
MSWLDSLNFGPDGLIPVATQEADSGTILMIAYANREALARTEATGRAHYWSRSRSELWCKGETSGHVQHVREIRVDCDSDAVLYRVAQTGPACHTLAASCFFRAVNDGALSEVLPASHVLERIAEIVRQRDSDRPDDSYTTYLFSKGIDKILKKVGEEATEVVIAAKNAAGSDDPGCRAELSAEVADLFFHLLVMLQQSRMPLDEIWAELDRRFGAPPRTTRGQDRDRPQP